MPLLAIILAIVTGTALGVVWYSPLMFGHEWAKLSGIVMDSSKKSGVWKSYVMSLLLTIVTATVIYTLLAAGFSMGDLFAIWSAFTLPVFAGEVFWDGRSTKLFLIKAGYNIIALAFMAQVILWVR